MRRVIALALFFFSTTAFADCGETLTLGCAGVAGALTSSDCAASDGSRYDVWTFSGTADQSVTLQLTSTAFDTLLVLIDPSGFPVAENDDSIGTDSRIAFVLTSTGTWTIVANALSSGGSGDYFLGMTCPSSKRRRISGSV